jgi:hypothetical protein
MYITSNLRLFQMEKTQTLEFVVFNFMMVLWGNEPHSADKPRHIGTCEDSHALYHVLGYKCQSW